MPASPSAARALAHRAVVLIALVVSTVGRLGAQTKAMTITGVSTWLDWYAWNPSTGMSYTHATFTVKNSGTQVEDLYVERTCGRYCVNGSPPASGVIASGVQPGQTINVDITLQVPDGASDTTMITLVAQGVVQGTRLSPADTAWASADVSTNMVTQLSRPKPSNITVTPNGTTSWVAAGLNTVAFTIKDYAPAASLTANLSLRLLCGGYTYTVQDPNLGAVVKSCGYYAGSYAYLNEQTAFPITLGGGGIKYIYVAFNGTNGQSGYIKLLRSMIDPATGSMVTDTASVLVNVGDPASPSASVTPVDGTVVASSPIPQVRIDWCDPNDALVQHDVTWQGQALPSTYTSTTKSGCYTAGYSVYSSLAINAGQQSLVATARDAAGHVVTSTTRITYSPPLTAYQPKVTATAGQHTLPGPDPLAAVDTFTVRNNGSLAASYSIQALCDGRQTVSDCYLSVGGVTLNPGASQSTVLHYTRSGALDYPDTLKVVARYTSTTGAIADTARKVVIANAIYTPIVGKMAPQAISANGRRSFGFSVLDNGNAAGTYTLTVSCSGAMTSCALPNSGTTMSIALQTGAWSGVNVAVTSGAVGSSGQIRLILTAPARASDGIVQADTSTVTLTAADLTVPTVNVEPFGTWVDAEGYYSVPSDSTTVFVDICDSDGTLADPAFKVNGVSIAPLSVVNTSVSGCFTARRVSYKPMFPDGPGDIVVDVSDGYHTATRQVWWDHDSAREDAPAVAALHPTITVPTNTTSADTFVVTNRSLKTLSYALTAVCYGNPPTLTCSMSSNYKSITLSPGASTRVPVTYNVGLAGSSNSVTLTAAYNGYYETSTARATFTASAIGSVAPTIGVSPANGTTVTSSPVSQVKIDWCDSDDALTRHDVVWQGQTLPDTYVAATRSGCYAAGTSTYTNLSISLWQQSLVATATDAAGHTVTSATTITFAPPLSKFAPKVTPTPDWRVVPASAPVTTADTFTVRNNGTYAASYAVNVACGTANTLSGCARDKGALSLGPGASDQVIVTYTRSGATDTADTLGLLATYTSPVGGIVVDTGRKIVIAPSVEPPPRLNAVRPSVSMTPNIVIVTDWFGMQNVGVARTRYHLAFAATNGFSIRLATDTVTLDPGQAIAPYVAIVTPTSAGVTGTLTLTASYVSTTGQTVSASASVSLTTVSNSPTTPTIALAGSSAPLLTPNSASSVAFTVTNTGSTTAIVSYARTCSGAAIAVCGALSRQLDTLSAGRSVAVSVNITTGSSVGPTGAVTLTATTSSIAASASVSVAIGIVNGPLAMGVAAQLNPGASIARDQCLTIAAGDAGAYECGDLRLVHALPTTTTMNKARAPTLIYMSGHAHPVTRVAADVTVDGSICPTQLIARVHFANSDTAERSFAWNGPCGQRTTRRIVVPVDAAAHSLSTNVYRYTFELRAIASGVEYQINDTSGVLVVVNRSDSRFGSGWWLDGVEQLQTVPSRGDQLLWIGGDGSTRLYTQQPGTNTFLVRPTVDRPDTLEQLSGGAGYRRHLRNGAYVEFDGYFRHSATVNAAGHVTRFYWTLSQLDSIALPIANPGNASARRTYKFAYTNGLLTSVTGPQGTNAPRVTVLTRAAQPSGIDLAITDPGDPAVHYFSDAAGRITVRTNRLGVGTRYGYDAASSAVTRAAIDLTNTSGTTDSIRTTFCPAESNGLAACAGVLVDPASVRTLVDGPRTDVADTTAFYLTAYGAPQRITDALGHTTAIEHADQRWPLLSTAAVQANGHRLEATYTDRGLVAELRDINPFGRDANEVARTQYQWNATFDKVDAVTAPTGEISRFGYFSNGDRQWQEDGRGFVSRTWFTYNGSRQLSSVQPPANSAVELQRLDYDPTSGNLVREITPLNDTTFYHSDAIGRVDSIATPANDTQQRSETYVFDVADRMIWHRSIGPAVATPRGSAPAVTLSDTTAYDAESRPLYVMRKPEPNLANTGYPETRWTYDAAGRKLTEERTGGSHHAWTYDAAGNIVAWSTGRYSKGLPVVVTTTYDVLDRPSHRTMPQITVAAERGDSRFPCEHPPRFPYFSYLTSGSVYDPTGESSCDGITPLPQPLVIPADVADFTYDVVGNLKTANNNDARITRDYYPNGELKTETQAIAIFDDLTPLDARFNTHRYRLDYGYDLSGRRLTRTDSIPTCAACVQTYHYDPASGLLDGMTDGGAGHNPGQFALQYDGAGRLSAWTVNGSVARTDMGYDANGRLQTRSVTGAGAIIYQDGIGYDRSGRIASTSINSQLAEIAGSTVSVYNGLGALAYFSQNRNGTLLDDEFVTDGLGNRIADKRWIDGQRTSHEYRYSRELLDQVNQLTPWQIGNPPPPPALQKGDTTTTNYGSTGAVEHQFRAGFVFNTNTYSWQPDTLGDEWTWHAYGADERLRVSQRSVQAPQVRTRTVFSDYRYDALGRRVAARTRWDPYCQLAEPECLSTIERTIWDGDQVLMELRGPAASEVEYGYGKFVGTVKYTHGAGIDEPLAIWKDDVGGVVPHRSWRGTYEAGTPIDASSGNVTWPARTQDVFRAPDVRLNPIQPSNWMGSIVDGKTDPSGLQFMRNRYYDPRNGRFTQGDPIGLAGGMNLYGFGGGDPVNYSDPFGLAPEMCPPVCAVPGAVGPAGALIALTAAASATAEEVAAGIDAVAKAISDKLTYKFVTYTRVGPNGQFYSGRTSGFGDPQGIVNRRVSDHPDRLRGFGPGNLDRWATGVAGYEAVRGREQQLIDFHGGAQSDGGSSANMIRGVSKYNDNGYARWVASNMMFGPLAPYTGSPR